MRRKIFFLGSEAMKSACNCSRNKRGAITIIVALSMMIIIFFAALAIDLGFLTMEKDDLQNKVDAAVESGVRVMHGQGVSGAVTEAWKSLRANGEDVTRENVEASSHIGFYDYRDIYTDFSTFKDFAFVDEMPSGESANAFAILNLKKDVDTIEIKPSGQTKGRVGASAVAYFKNYTFLALSDSGDAMRWSTWADGFPAFRKCLIGCNADILFNGTESFTDTRIEAVGTVSTVNGNPAPPYLEVPEISIPPINWAKLQQDAQGNGKVYDCETWTDAWQTDEFGNKYCRRYAHRDAQPATWSQPAKPDRDRVRYFFQPHAEIMDSANNVLRGDGDHQGRTYYFNMPTPTDLGYDGEGDAVILYLLTDSADMANNEKRRYWNITIAATGPVSNYPLVGQGYGWTGNPDIPATAYETHYGNYENIPDASGLVTIYCQDMGTFNDNPVDQVCMYPSYGSTNLKAYPKGLVILTEGHFYMYQQYTGPMTCYLKVVANTMNLSGPWASAMGSMTFMGPFSPPDLYALGLLETP